VKRDGCKDKSSDRNSINEKPIMCWSLRLLVANGRKNHLLIL
jgi:hypothetical protein